MKQNYKLHTVASRFGGNYARKALILTTDAYLSEGIERRAKDMGIYIVRNAIELTQEEWARAFKKIAEK